MHKVKKIELVVILFFIVISVMFYFRPLIYRSEKQIYNKLLEDTPVGCNKQFVLEYVKKKGYVFDIAHQGARDDKIGNNYMRVYLGHYRGIPFRCDVTVFWIFDEKDKLSHIDVWKDYDAL